MLYFNLKYTIFCTSTSFNITGYLKKQKHIFITLFYELTFNILTWSCVKLIFKSESLNSYGIFHPNDPNVRLSCIKAWKKHNANSNLCHKSDLLQELKNDGSAIGSAVKERSKLARTPRGASIVNFIPKRSQGRSRNCRIWVHIFLNICFFYPITLFDILT